MWMHPALPIEVSRVAVVPIGAQLWDEVINQPIDITGYSFSGLIAPADGEEVTASFPVTVSNAFLGMIDFTIDGTQFANEAGPKEVVSLAYQIKATDQSGLSAILARGPLILTPGI